MTKRALILFSAFCFGVFGFVQFGAESARGQPADVEETPIPMTLSELEEEILRREEDLSRYSERLSILEKQNGDVRQRLEEQEEELRRQETHLRRRILTLSRLSRGGYVQLLRGARTWAEIISRAQLVRAVVDQDVEALHEHQRQVNELARQREALSRRVKAKRQLQERIVRYRQELQAERQRRLDARSGQFAPQSIPGSSTQDDLEEGLPPLEL